MESICWDQRHFYNIFIFFSFVHVNQKSVEKKTPQKSMIGSPAVKFLSTVHGKLNSLAMMNLKILFTFMLWVALEKNRVAFIALAYALACMRAKVDFINELCYNWLI